MLYTNKAKQTHAIGLNRGFISVLHFYFQLCQDVMDNKVFGTLNMLDTNKHVESAVYLLETKLFHFINLI